MGLKSKLGKCVNVPQIKALLWKDVLIKKRQPVSIFMIVKTFFTMFHNNRMITCEKNVI